MALIKGSIPAEARTRYAQHLFVHNNALGTYARASVLEADGQAHSRFLGDWVFTTAPTPDVLSEIETCSFTALEAWVERTWGVQGVLL